jgi:hypothetical protein
MLDVVLWGGFSLLLAEVLRDGYHVLCHQVPWLAKWHNWHHSAYRRDLSVVSLALYRKAQLYHDIFESLLLVGILALLAAVSSLPGLWVGVAYALLFLAGGTRRYWSGTIETDLNHLPGPLTTPPAPWWVNRSYHWRHHFENPKAYYSGVCALVDQVLGTALSLKGKTVVLTGASGALGQALIGELHAHHAQVIALTTSVGKLPEQTGVTIIPWELGQEANLLPYLQKADILITNHGINLQGARTSVAIDQSYEVNTFSTLRLIDLFLTTVSGPYAKASKEVWVNTSEAEVNPALSPLYELSKRALGELITLKRLENICVVRKLILGPFKSPLNPVGVMKAEDVAKGILFWAVRDCRDIIVTINPLTYLLYPLKETFTSLYYRTFTKNTV